ncbi:MAG: leucine-rich repeat domain-containing protein [Candidatus Thorarchaeota archaeon]
MSIKLTYTTINGDVKEVEFERGAKEIPFRRRELLHIDLAPLSSCKALEEIYLDGNQLQSIDLAPLSSCKSLKKLFLSENQLQSVDLAPLSSCTKLRVFWLHDNQLQSIDVAPLSSCKALEELDLNGNQIQSIDLTPLSSCTRLKWFNLSANKLRNIDLNPLSACTKLYVLRLYNNQLQNIDLTPLGTCTRLMNLDLAGNQLQSIDLIPLSSCTEIADLNLRNNQIQSIDLTPLSSSWRLRNLNIYSIKLQRAVSWLRLTKREQGKAVYTHPSERYPWSYLRDVLEFHLTSPTRDSYRKASILRIQNDILRALGLSDYGFIGRDMTNTLLSLSSDNKRDFVQFTLAEVLKDEVVATIDREGHSIGLNIESLSSRHDEIAKRAKDIIRLRADEIEQTTIAIHDNTADLRPLWLTAYGYEICSALCLRLDTDSTGVEQVKRAIGDVGLEVHLGESSVYGVDVSEEFKECIWWIAKHMGRAWSHSSEIIAYLGNNEPWKW